MTTYYMIGPSSSRAGIARLVDLVDYMHQVHAEGYLRRQLEESAEEGLDPEGGWRIWWDTTGSGSGPRGPRYATCAAAEAAAKLANEELSDTPGGNLLCGFAVAFLDEDGDWRRFDPERDAYTRG